MKQKNVGFCVPHLAIGGIETVLMNTIAALDKRGDVQITLVTHSNICAPRYAEFLKSRPNVRYVVMYPLYTWFKRFRHFPLRPIAQAVFSLYKQYRRARVRITGKLADVDVFVNYKGYGFRKETKPYHKPNVLWIHGSITAFTAHDLKRVAQCDRAVTLTDEFVDEFRQTYPQYAHKITRIYNPIDGQSICDRAQAGTPGVGQYFCHVSRLDAGKDIKTLVDAFDIFAATHQDISLYIVGDGALKNDFQRYARTKKSAARIVFTGAQNNPYGYMQGAIANILSSQSEGFGMVLVESMALARPTISSNCKNGPKEILENGRGGFLFDVGNAAQLAQCMAQVVDNPKDAQKRVQIASRHMMRFAPETIAQDIMDMINSL